MMKLLFPDACWNTELISGALFLYFHDEKLGFTLHPSVSTFLTGADPFEFVRFVEIRRPEWLPKFSEFLRLWTTYRSSLQRTSELLEPLRGTGFATIWMCYPRDSVAWNSAEELLASSQLERTEITQLVDPFSASDELFSHIFFGRYLELYEGHRTTEELVALGAERAGSEGVGEPVHVDWKTLYRYCDQRFGSAELGTILTTAYMFRMPALKAGEALLLSNPLLLRFLGSLPVDPKRPGQRIVVDVDLDAIAWEFFRQVVSPRLDPLDRRAIEKVAALIEHHSSEIDALKRRCLGLAQDLGGERNLELLQKRIRDHIRVNVERELQAVLSLDSKAVRQLLDSVFSDKKTWIGIAALLYSLLNGGPALTAGAAIYALSSVGSKAVKAAADRRQKLEVSDYAILYRMRR